MSAFAPDELPHGVPPSLSDLGISRTDLKYRRWPCHRCGHTARRISVICPQCEALPWPAVTPLREAPGEIATRILKPGSDLETRSRGLIGNRHRFSTPAGFLGVLSRRFTSGADWLGCDGREWRIDRLGALGRAFILHDGPVPIAAAEARGFWRHSYQLWQGTRTFLLMRTGVTRRSFLLAVEDGPEVLRIHGGILRPLRRIEIVSEVPVATAALTGFLACRMRQGESD